MQVQEYWKKWKIEIRKFYKGLGRNVNSEIKQKKQQLTKTLEELDNKMNDQDINIEEWELRIHKEEWLEKLYSFEEKMWQQRCEEKWVLEGDRNTTFFHGVENGRKRNVQ